MPEFSGYAEKEKGSLELWCSDCCSHEGLQVLMIPQGSHYLCPKCGKKQKTPTRTLKKEGRLRLRNYGNPEIASLT
jgi:Zn finger protein HypA/HybF involved in hydrogenase expression